MKPVRDPEDQELKHLLAAVEIGGKTVLEIGCGDGYFTRQYTRMARQVVGIDPADALLSLARKTARNARVFFLQAEGQKMPFPSRIFDLAIFASSL